MPKNKPPISRWREYKKALVAGGGGMALAGLAALEQTSVLSSYPWANAGVAVVTAMGVYRVRNELPTTAHVDMSVSESGE